MKIKLLEENQIYVYRDTTTGKKYIFNGTSLQELTDDEGDGTGPSIQIDIPDEPPKDTSKKKSSGRPGDEPEDEPDGPDKPDDPGKPDDTDRPDGPDGFDGPGSFDDPDDFDDFDDSDRPGGSKDRPDGSPEEGKGAKRGGKGEADPDFPDGDSDLDIDLDHILDEIDDLSKIWDDLSDEQKQYLRDKANEVDKDTLEKEQKEREAQIEKETEDLGELPPDSKAAESKLEEIGSLLDSDAVLRDLLDETDRIVRRDRQTIAAERKAAEQEVKKYTASDGISDFVLDINKLIKSEVKNMVKKDWGRFNKRAEGSGILKPGKSTKKNPHIPRLFVYYDASGSWGASDIAVGNAAISTLRAQYEKKGQLIIEIYYFASELGPTRASAGRGWYECFQKVYADIQEKRPDNVMIMTDGDGDRYLSETHLDKKPPIYVPGGMFILFRDGDVSKQVARVFRGRKVSKIYKF